MAPAMLNRPLVNTRRQELSMMRHILIAALLLAGCTPIQASGEDFDFTAADEKGDRSHSGRTELLGALSIGETSEEVEYSRVPYAVRAFELVGVEGREIRVDVRVHSADGDPAMWIVDGSLATLKFNKDRDATTRNARIVITPSGSFEEKYYVIFADEDLSSGRFSVSVSDAEGEKCSGATAFCGPGKIWSVDQCRCITDTNDCRSRPCDREDTCELSCGEEEYWLCVPRDVHWC
jgi:hypothetical protein